MGQTLGLATAALQLGLEAILVKPKRSIGAFSAYVTFEEQHEDDLMITEQPVEVGAKITDHSYKLPPRVTIKCGWSNSPTSTNILGSLANSVTGTVSGVSAILGGNSKSQVKDIYNKLLLLQESRVPFDVLTGKRAYRNMLVKSLSTETNKETENALVITAVLQQVILVSVKSVKDAAPPASQNTPQQTMRATDKGTKNLDPAPSYNSSRRGQ